MISSFIHCVPTLSLLIHTSENWGGPLGPRYCTNAHPCTSCVLNLFTQSMRLLVRAFICLFMLVSFVCVRITSGYDFMTSQRLQGEGLVLWESLCESRITDGLHLCSIAERIVCWMIDKCRLCHGASHRMLHQCACLSSKTCCLAQLLTSLLPLLFSPLAVRQVKQILEQVKSSEFFAQEPKLPIEIPQNLSMDGAQPMLHEVAPTGSNAGIGASSGTSMEVRTWMIQCCATSRSLILLCENLHSSWCVCVRVGSL